jgi:hypothetical protein
MIVGAGLPMLTAEALTRAQAGPNDRSCRAPGADATAVLPYVLTWAYNNLGGDVTRLASD